MKIRFELDDDFLTDKIINIPVCVIIVKSVYEEDSKYYALISLYECFYEYEHKKYINPLVVN